MTDMIQDGVVQLPPSQPAPTMPLPTQNTLGTLQAQAEADIDWFYGTATATGTNSANQAMIYAVKVYLARDFLKNGGEPDELLVNEAEDRGMSPTQLAEEIVAMGRVEQARERARIQAKIAIRMATSEKEIKIAMINAEVPSASGRF